MREYIITIEDWFFRYAHERYTHFFGCPIEEIVRCRDCKHATISTMGVCKYCEMFVLPDTDGYGADAQVNLPLDFFCAWGEKRTNE